MEESSVGVQSIGHGQARLGTELFYQLDGRKISVNNRLSHITIDSMNVIAHKRPVESSGNCFFHF